jgi:hypothetical protein
MCAQSRLLIVTAHPDHESFPIGGTVARYASQGVHVTLLCATRGEKGIPGVSAAETARIREQELRNAAAQLGVTEVRFLDLIDGEVAHMPGDALVENDSPWLCGAERARPAGRPDAEPGTARDEHNQGNPAPTIWHRAHNDPVRVRPVQRRRPALHAVDSPSDAGCTRT